MVECIDCEGEGEYESPQPQAHGETSYTTHTCYTCDGTGEKPEEVTFREIEMEETEFDNEDGFY